MSERAVIVLGHGSRAADATGQFLAVTARLARRLPGTVVLPAFMELAEPSLESAVSSAVARGARDVSVLPCFLWSGNHIKHDIPECVAEACAPHDVAVRILDPIGPDSRLTDILLDRLGWPDSGPRDLAPVEIEAASMAVVDSALDARLTAEERAVARRLVHASGEPSIGAALRFSEGGVAAGVRALAAGAPVVTDVRMVATGVDERRLSGLGGSLLCAVDDPEVVAASAAGRRTRAATAIRSLTPRLSGAVVAIGNAPTALREVLALHAEGVTPALVVGLPVGFIDAPESKTALLGSGLPFVTLPGTRGGSPLAAAAVNAMLRLAEEGAASR